MRANRSQGCLFEIENAKVERCLISLNMDRLISTNNTCAEEDLRCLGEDKLRAIRSYTKFFAGTDPA